VGDRRRDEMFNVLAGRQADGTPLSSAAAGSESDAAAAAPIPVEQLVVYETLVAEGAAAANAATEVGASSSELSTFLQQLLSQLAELDAEFVSRSGRPLSRLTQSDERRIGGQRSRSRNQQQQQQQRISEPLKISQLRLLSCENPEAATRPH